MSTKNVVEFSITTDGRQEDYETDLKVASHGLIAASKVLAEFTETTPKGAVKFPQGKPESSIGVAFRQGPVKVCGLIQQDIIDVFAKARKEALNSLKKWVGSHSKAVPEFFFTPPSGAKHQINTKEIAELIVAANDGSGDEPNPYLDVIYTLARDSVEYGLLIEQANTALLDVVKSVKRWRHTARAPFSIDIGSYNPSSWYQMQTKTRVEINRMAAKG